MSPCIDFFVRGRGRNLFLAMAQDEEEDGENTVSPPVPGSHASKKDRRASSNAVYPVKGRSCDEKKGTEHHVTAPPRDVIPIVRRRGKNRA